MRFLFAAMLALWPTAALGDYLKENNPWPEPTAAMFYMAIVCDRFEQLERYATEFDPLPLDFLFLSIDTVGIQSCRFAKFFMGKPLEYRDFDVVSRQWHYDIQGVRLEVLGGAIVWALIPKQ